jgi:hypothetical protein
MWFEIQIIHGKNLGYTGVTPQGQRLNPTLSTHCGSVARSKPTGVGVLSAAQWTVSEGQMQNDDELTEINEHFRVRR